jgi:hypothetical protein
MDRDRLEFRYFFNAGLDKVTGLCDVEGSDVYEIDDNGERHYLGSINYVMPDEIAEMDDDELDEVFDQNMIFPFYS